MNITSDDILGKLAIARSGAVLGTVVKLHIDKHKKEMIGITVDQGFLKPDLFIGIDFIKTFGVDALLLNEVPYSLIKGREVIDIAGAHIGEVKQVNATNNKIISLVIKHKRELIEVKASRIKRIGVRVIVRKNWKPQQETQTTSE